ncbi:hypothetical protein PCANC_15189 [Puccinia coronata f. sp. avenae]|uniref:Uncharacterized protein n=1 Tax=Puccinia coronata f. sp. avenae TaxID=200324 RepID=A0A2N5UFA9_9BASI|nr:hypothetical protein PCANC_15189 [Puccinia coronata f. sp. avenae]
MLVYLQTNSSCTNRNALLPPAIGAPGSEPTTPPMDHFSDIERSPSPSARSMEEWLHHPLTPPSNRHVPQLFDGTAHLTARRNRCREAFIERQKEIDPSLAALTTQTSQSRDQSTSPQVESSRRCEPSEISHPDAETSLGRHEVPIHIDSPPIKKIQSELDKVILWWRTEEHDLDYFKDSVIRAIKMEEDDFSANQKRRLDTPEIFKQFLAVASGTSESRKIVCRIVQKDPKMAAERESAYKHLKRTHESTSQDDATEQPSEGAQSSASLSDLVMQLFAKHEPVAHLTGSHELNVAVNPYNNNEFFPLSLPRANIWAKALKSKALGVTLRDPPKTELFAYEPKNAPGPSDPSNGRASAAQNTVVPPPPSINGLPPAPWTMPYSTMPMNPIMSMYGNVHPLMLNAMNTNAMNTLNPTNQNGVNVPPTSTPRTPPGDTSTLQDFFRFARVEFDSPEINGGLQKIGLTHWSMFKNYKSHELTPHGVPDAPARALVVAANEYGRHLYHLSQSQ